MNLKEQLIDAINILCEEKDENDEERLMTLEEVLEKYTNIEIFEVWKSYKKDILEETIDADDIVKVVHILKM